MPASPCYIAALPLLILKKAITVEVLSRYKSTCHTALMTKVQFPEPM